MSDLLQRIADYFRNQYKGKDETAPKMELSVNDLRNIVALNIEKCRLETKLRNLQQIKTNADRIRNMTDEELYELIKKAERCGGLLITETSSFECRGCRGGFCCDVMQWLQSEAK